MSPPKQRRLNQTPLENKFNCLGLQTPKSGRKKVVKSLFDNEIKDENQGSPSKCKREDTKPVNPYEKAKRALNSSFLTELKYRDSEYNEVQAFLSKCLEGQEPGSLYVSGAPGTGKTFCVTRVIEKLKDKINFKSILVNCMGCRTPNSIFCKILTEAGLSTPKKAKDSIDVLTDEVITPGKKKRMTVLVLDEIDELEDKNRDVLYTIFDWPRLHDSRIIVIGICNTLDFTTRSLKRCHTIKDNSIQSINFKPYSKDQVKGILSSRLPNLNGTPLVAEQALELCARKVSSFSGDIRKALHVLRRAIELVEMESKPALPLRLTSDDGSNSPRKREQPTTIVSVGVHHVLKVLNEVYASKALEMSKGNQSMPTQQQLALCVLLLFNRSSVKEVVFSKFHSTFVKVCNKKAMGFSVDSSSEFLGMCQLLESKGFLLLKKGKETSLTKISLNVNQQEIEEVMTDKSLFQGILADPSFLK